MVVIREPGSKLAITMTTRSVAVRSAKTSRMKHYVMHADHAPAEVITIQTVFGNQMGNAPAAAQLLAHHQRYSVGPAALVSVLPVVCQKCHSLTALVSALAVVRQKCYSLTALVSVLPVVIRQKCHSLTALVSALPHVVGEKCHSLTVLVYALTDMLLLALLLCHSTLPHALVAAIKTGVLLEGF